VPAAQKWMLSGIHFSPLIDGWGTRLYSMVWRRHAIPFHLTAKTKEGLKSCRKQKLREVRIRAGTVLRI
jgi:hypothetical protein